MLEQLKAHHTLTVNPPTTDEKGFLIENTNKYYLFLNATFKQLVYGRHRTYHCYTNYCKVLRNVKPDGYKINPSRWVRNDT